jgi:hypothetical protein
MVEPSPDMASASLKKSPPSKSPSPMNLDSATAGLATEKSKKKSDK